MRKIGLLILMVCCFGMLKADSYLPEAVRIESRRLYNDLKLAGTISLPAFQKALAGYNQYTSGRQELLVLIDFTKPSTEERFCVVDLAREKVLFRSHVAHGRGSGENYAVAFSNQPGSYKSSLGFYRTGGTYMGKNGYSLLLDGLEYGVNDRARERAIVVHGAEYADPEVLHGQNRLGRSLGCPALPPSISREVIDAIKSGALLYIYGRTPDQEKTSRMT